MKTAPLSVNENGYEGLGLSCNWPMEMDVEDLPINENVYPLPVLIQG